MNKPRPNLLLALLWGGCFLSPSLSQGTKANSARPIGIETGVAVHIGGDISDDMGSTTAPSSDPIVLSFVFIGCNRVGWSVVDGIPLPASTVNEPQLLQTFEDISRLDRLPEYFFFVGDLVRNEQSGETLTRQLKQWQILWDKGALATSGIQLVPIAGNHEVLKSIQTGHKQYYEVPDATAYPAWLEWINSEKHPPQPGNGPTPSSHLEDLLAGDNQQFSYSFAVDSNNGKRVRFMVLNTDTDSTYRNTSASCCQHPVEITKELPPPGWIPFHWAAEEVDSSDDLLFALGHKPIAYPANWKRSMPSNGANTIYNCGHKMLARDLAETFQESGNFVAYLCAHKHLWEAFRIEDSIWQVIAGNGGSPLERGDQFGFTLVNIFESGKVVAIPHERAVPYPYYGKSGVLPAKPGVPVLLKEAGW